MNLSNRRTLPDVHTVRRGECDSASSPQLELTSALGAAISATKTISFRYLLTGPLSSATAATLASSKPPFGAGREKELERTEDGLRREENPSFSSAAAECQCIQFKLSSLRLSFSPLKVWKRRRKEMRGRNRPNAEKISGSETATASREEKEEAEE